jgi:hypothetical protein
MGLKACSKRWRVRLEIGAQHVVEGAPQIEGPGEDAQQPCHLALRIAREREACVFLHRLERVGERPAEAEAAGGKSFSKRHERQDRPSGTAVAGDRSGIGDGSARSVGVAALVSTLPCSRISGENLRPPFR